MQKENVRCGWKKPPFLTAMLRLATGGYRSNSTSRRRVDEMDLGPIMFKLMLPENEEGHGWTREKCEQIAVLYRNFMYESVCGTTLMVPTKDIDAMWHTHILDTEKYRADCRHVFGQFIHHFPYFGMRGEEDKLALQEAFETGRKVFEAKYGVNYDAESIPGCPGHGGGCSRRIERGNRPTVPAI